MLQKIKSLLRAHYAQVIFGVLVVGCLTFLFVRVENLGNSSNNLIVRNLPERFFVQTDSSTSADAAKANNAKKTSSGNNIASGSAASKILGQIQLDSEIVNLMGLSSVNASSGVTDVSLAINSNFLLKKASASSLRPVVYIVDNSKGRFGESEVTSKIVEIDVLTGRWHRLVEENSPKGIVAINYSYKAKEIAYAVSSNQSAWQVPTEFKIYHTDSEKIDTIKEYPGNISSVSWSPDGKTAAFVAEQQLPMYMSHTVCFYDKNSGQVTEYPIDHIQYSTINLSDFTWATDSSGIFAIEQYFAGQSVDTYNSKPMFLSRSDGSIKIFEDKINTNLNTDNYISIGSKFIGITHDSDKNVFDSKINESVKINNHPAWVYRYDLATQQSSEYKDVMGEYMLGFGPWIVKRDGSAVVYTKNNSLGMEIHFLNLDSGADTKLVTMSSIYKIIGWNGNEKNIVIWNGNNIFYNLNLDSKDLALITQ